MRVFSQTAVLIVVMAVPAFGQLAPSESPARAPTLIGAARNATPVAPGASRANLEIADTTAIDIAAAPLVCEAPDPNACPALPEVTGFADSTPPVQNQSRLVRLLYEYLVRTAQRYGVRLPKRRVALELG